MAREIRRHATRPAAEHEAALDADFRAGQRVRTLDGYTGRILEITDSFAPGNTAYQVVLDNGMGGGTYLSSQLRPIPGSYQAPSSPASHLPAGVTAALEAEADLDPHTADRDYPELGTILQDRPDPAGQFAVIGMRRTAASYTEGHDPRDGEYDGEPDLGIYWQAPAQQQWVNDNLGEPPTAPPPEEGEDEAAFEPAPFPSIEATTMSGRPGTGDTTIDGHGDAPGHGSDPDNPRAASPNAYDDSSTEGTGDPQWSEPMPDVDKRDANGAQIGMYPEGMSGGDGPGLSIGGFTAHLHEARVPWTGEQRAELHGWDNGQAASAGDFVPSTNFTNRHPVTYHEDPPAEEVVENELQVLGSVEDDPRWHLIHEHGMMPQDIDDILRARQVHNYRHTGPSDHFHPGQYGDWDLHRTTPGQQEPYDERGPVEDASTSWGVQPEDLATPGQHAGGERRNYVMHTLSALGDADPFAHVRDFHGWDPETISYLHEHGGLEAEHHAEHVNTNGNVHRAPAEIGLCAYTHQGDCAWPGPSMARNGESMRHSRPRGLELDLKELGDHHPDRGGALSVVGEAPTHVIRAYKGGYHLGDLHFQQSDDGRAIRVNMLHTMAGQRQGIGSAMMDRLYSHANEQGAWIDHGTRTGAGRGWWNSYREPYPELNTHSTGPDEPMQPTPAHPGGAAWSSYFSPSTVSGDMHANAKEDEKHPLPGFDASSYPHDPRNEMWRHARPRPVDESDAMLDQLAKQHGWEASLQAQAAFSDEDWADHLREFHGYGDSDITHMYYQHGRLDDPHQAIHDAGLADHDHLPAGNEELERQLDDRFGPQMPIPARPWQQSPGLGGRAPGDPYHTMDVMHGLQARPLPDPRTHPHVYSALEAEAANRRRADAVYGQLAGDFPHDAISWVHDKGVRWHGPYDADPSEIDWNGRDTWAAYNQPEKVAKSGKKAAKKREKGEDPKPAIGTQGPGQALIRAQDGHHRALSALVEGQPLHAYVAQVPERQGPWDEMHSKQFTGGDTGKKQGPDGTDEERAEFQDKVEGSVRRVESERDSLDHGEAPPGTDGAPPQVKGKGSARKGGARPPVVPRQRHGNPSTWPLATALIQDGYPALSQGGQDGKQRKMPAPTMPGQDPLKPGKKEKKAALAAFTAAAASTSFRFEFTASWRDVLAKAQRIRKAGRVRITYASPGMVIGAVGGDHDVYESGIQRPPGKPQTIQHWACGCPWASFRQASLKREARRRGLNGRPCSHVMALQLESTARGGSRGKDIERDPHRHEMGLPRADVVVKSMPPWTSGGWAETWIAPAASLHKNAEMFCPACGDDRDQLGQCYGCGLVSHDPRDSGGPDPDTPEGKVWLDHHHVRAALILLEAGEKRKDIEDLAAAAGVHLGELSPSSRLIERHLEVAHGVQGGKVADWRQKGQGPDVMHYRLHKARAAMVLPHGHQRDEQTGQLTGPVPLRQQAAANDPWGDNNYAAHPPQKPYGATSPPQRDMSPGSYGPLAGPDPADWGEIEDTGLQQPLSNEAAWRGHEQVLASPQDQLVAPTYQSPPSRDLDYPAVANWQDERGDSFPYADQSNTAGPSTAAEPRDPNGIRMEESRDPEADKREYERHLIEDHGAEPWEGMHTDHALHQNDHSDMEHWAREHGPGPDDHPYHETDHERRWGRDRWPDASGSHDFIASALAAAMSELRATPEPALPETTADEPMALDPQATGGGPGMSPHDEDLTPSDYSIQTMGTQQAGEAEDSTGDLAFSVSPQESAAGATAGDVVAAFQATAAARQYAGDGQPAGDVDIAAAAKEHLAKTAEALPQAEADELIREGRGQRARNLDLLQLEGTHYEDNEDLEHRGASLDDDDLALV